VGRGATRLLRQGDQHEVGVQGSEFPRRREIRVREIGDVEEIAIPGSEIRIRVAGRGVLAKV
jgi:hypothetical protein